MKSLKAVINAAIFAASLSIAPSHAQNAPGVTEKDIRVGILNVLTGPIALQGVPVANGVEAYFSQLKDSEAGLGGRKVAVVKQDHQFNAQTANQAFAQMAPNVSMFANVFGTAIIAALNRRIKESGSVVMASTFASNYYADQQLVIPFTPYPIQLDAGIDYLIKEKSGKDLKWAIISRNDNQGVDGVIAFDHAVKVYGLKVVTYQTYEPTDTDFTAQIQGLKDSGADVVVLANSSSVTAQLVVGLARLGSRPIWLGWQPSFDPTLAKNKEFMDIVAQTPLYIASCLPAWSAKVAGMEDVRAARSKYFPNQAEDPFFTFGYIQAAVTHAILVEATKRNDFSRAGMLEALKAVGVTDLKGLLSEPVDFSKRAQERYPRAAQIWKVDASAPSFQAPVTGNFVGDSAASFPMPK
ncbi:ABC transporter substrate-binding protein [Bradyrhizobium sp. 14AA]